MSCKGQTDKEDLLLKFISLVLLSKVLSLIFDARETVKNGSHIYIKEKANMEEQRSGFCMMLTINSQSKDHFVDASGEATVFINSDVTNIADFQ